MKRPIYLDYAATTPVDPDVAAKMMDYLTLQGQFGNPASGSHQYGWEAEQAVEQARQQVAQLINAEPKEIIWTSGATEANNLAIKGVAYFYQHRGQHIVTCKTEHKAVLDSCRQLEKEGFKVTYLQPLANGLIDLNQLTDALRQDTILVSIMQVNNEIGVIQDVAAIGEITREKNILLHVDAAQSAGKVAIDVQQIKVDLMSLSAHKMYGPKGIGALYVRHKPKARLKALIHGGNQEQGLRSGTLATHQIVGMGEACRIAKASWLQDHYHIKQLYEHLWQGLRDCTDIYLNGDDAKRVDHISNFSVANVNGQALLMALKELALSSGSACNSATQEASHVLRAIGVPAELAYSAVRLSMGRYTTVAEIDYAVDTLRTAITRLRALSPLSSATDLAAWLAQTNVS